MSTEEKYVAAAYLVVLIVVLAYIVIISAKVARLERAVAELVDAANRNGGTDNVTTLLLQCLAA